METHHLCSPPAGEPPLQSHHLEPKQNSTTAFPIQQSNTPTEPPFSHASSSAGKETNTRQYGGLHQHQTTAPNQDHHVTPATISFKDTIIKQTGDETMDMILGEDEPSEDDEPVSAHSQPTKSRTPIIHLTTNTKAHTRQPWKKTLIIKTIGAFFSATAIAPRLNGIWRPTGKLEVIQLANGFHIIKFHQENDYHKALEQGPWFIGTHFLSVQRWSHNFDPNTQKIATLAVWVRLNGLPMEYFDKEILTVIGKKIGVPLQIDTITTSITRGRFARLCVQIDTHSPLIKQVQIGKYTQKLQYVNILALCRSCECIAHSGDGCPIANPPQTDYSTAMENNQQNSLQPHQRNLIAKQIDIPKDGPWTVVTRRRTNPRSSSVAKIDHRHSPVTQRSSSLFASKPRSHNNKYADRNSGR
ncbi:hypothetical protein RJ640_027132 [Escallonia rubra]|uniref:DUF4283 domain-containing protein n=1 Tax=Escallonia rubra TaxID=112253 RepID=A0AA88R970_9ASTE|nr:hypothetical protein RJ640_027132 [Escallonia rubra]